MNKIFSSYLTSLSQPQQACTELRTIAKALKVKVAEIDAIIRKLVKEKITDAKMIIAAVKAKLIELAKNFKCTDVLSEKVCPLFIRYLITSS